MEKIEYEGQQYYYIKGRFTDQSYIMVPDEINRELCKIYFSQKDYSSYTVDQLLEFIKELRKVSAHQLAIEACEYALEKFSVDRYLVKCILPMLSSSYRQVRQPTKAINLLSKYGQNGQSVPLLTSIAAAYCDVKDYIKAKQLADYAYALQGGNMGEQNELSLVYARIEAETTG